MYDHPRADDDELDALITAVQVITSTWIPCCCIPRKAAGPLYRALTAGTEHQTIDGHIGLDALITAVLVSTGLEFLPLHVLESCRSSLASRHSAWTDHRTVGDHVGLNALISCARDHIGLKSLLLHLPEEPHGPLWHPALPHALTTRQ